MHKAQVWSPIFLKVKKNPQTIKWLHEKNKNFTESKKEESQDGVIIVTFRISEEGITKKVITKSQGVLRNKSAYLWIH